MDALKTKVILVGNSIFPRWGGETRDIPNVEQNMELLKKVLVDKDFFGIPDDQLHIVELKDEPSQDILLRVKHETKSFSSKDKFERLIFYYSGHGIPGEDSILFFASRDTIRSDYEITSVNSKLLFNYLGGFKAKELIVILDCCYAAQSRENQGDPDSLISKNLPQENKEADTENGIYYLFAAGKDNVAKFNPEEHQKPTYFTGALLNAISNGIEAGPDYITMELLYNSICNEINTLKRTADPEIPMPRQVLQGNVGGYFFCKNVRFKNQEDADWNELQKNPDREKWLDFKKKYPATKFEKESDRLISKMINGERAIDTLKQKKNDIDFAVQIKELYSDIPYIKEEADQFIRNLAANPVQREKQVQNAAFTDAATQTSDIENAFALNSAPVSLNTETEPNLSRPESINPGISRSAGFDPSKLSRQ